MSGVIDLAATGLLALAYLLLSVFQSAAVAVAGTGTGRVREGQRVVPGPGRRQAPASLMMAVRAARQVCVLAAGLVMAHWFGMNGFTLPWLWSFGTVLVLLILVADQIIARSIALLAPAGAFSLTILPAKLLSFPLVPLTGPTARLYALFGRASGSSAARAEGDGNAQGLAAGAEELALETEEGELIENVVEFRETIVREVMTPRTEMVMIEEGATLDDLIRLVVKTNHSRIPVTRGGADHVVGMVHARDILSLWTEGSATGGEFGPITRPVMTVPESKRAMQLLREMQAGGAQMAILVDEYGGTAGLVTVEDLVEELVGEIADEHEVRKPALVRMNDGSWLVAGSFPVFDLADRMGVSLPEVEADTVGGMIVALLGRLPEKAETVETGGLTLRVEEADRRRVRRVRVTRQARGAAAAEDAGDPDS